MHALIFRMLVEGCLELVGIHVLQVLVQNSIVQQGDVLRNGDTLVSRHILISQFKTGVQNFLTGSLLDRLGFGFAPHRIAFVTDAMAATDCPDGHYLIGALDVNVEHGHARLASNGAIAGSALLLEKAVSRAVLELGISPVDAVEAATLTPAKAFGFDSRNDVTGFPLGLLAPGYASDVLLIDPETWTVRHVWCDGHAVR